MKKRGNLVIVEHLNNNTMSVRNNDKHENLRGIEVFQIHHAQLLS